MRTVTRRERQRIRIGPDIWVEVLAVRALDVRIGVDAPGLQVTREELLAPEERYEAVQERRHAVGSAAAAADGVPAAPRDPGPVPPASGPPRPADAAGQGNGTHAGPVT